MEETIVVECSRQSSIEGTSNNYTSLLYKGSAYKAGLGYTGFKWFEINIEFHLHTYSESKSNSSDSQWSSIGQKIKYKALAATISIPFSIKKIRR